MKIIDQLKWRYATKSFDSNKLLSKEQLNTIKESFNLTATSYGLQPIKLVIFSNKDLQKKLVSHTMDQEQLAQASHVLVFCIVDTIDKVFIENYFNLVKKIRNTPEKILKPFEDFLIDDFNNMNTKEIEAWAIKQAYLAMGNLLTVCAIEGIDACPMEGFSPDKYDKMLGLAKRGLKSVLVMPIGIRANDDIFADFKKVRREIKDVIVEL